MPLSAGGRRAWGVVAERSFLGAHVLAVTWTTSTFGEKIVLEPFFSASRWLRRFTSQPGRGEEELVWKGGVHLGAN